MTARKNTRKLTSEEAFLADMRAAAEPHWGRDADMRAAVLVVLKDILQTGRDEAREKLEANRLKGSRCAEFLSDLQDDIMRALGTFVSKDMLRMSNPTDAETVTVAPVLFARTPFDPRRKVGLFGYLSFRLMEVEQVEGRWKAKLKDSKPIFHLPRTPDFQRQIGRNTSYIIHPEEVLADNFALMLLGTAVRDQWVQDEMRQAIKRHVVQP